MSASKAVTIVALGDSITQAAAQAPADRWPAVLERLLAAAHPALAVRVVNAGVGGNTSREGLARVAADVLPHAPDLVLVEFGNDCVPDPARHVTEDEFAANLERIRDLVAAHCGGQTVLMTFTPLVDEWHSWHEHEMFQPVGGPNAAQEGYRERTRECAQRLGLPLVDLDRTMRQAMAAATPGDYILPDGVHLTTVANRFVAKLLAQELAPVLAAVTR